MFSQTNYIEQDSAKHHLTLAKANRVSKYCTRSLCKLFAIYNINLKARLNIIPSLLCLRKMNQ